MPYNDREAVFDALRIAELTVLIGAERLGALIDLLDQRLNRIMTWIKAATSIEEITYAVHQSRGSATSLGFTRLGDMLGQLERLLREAPKGADDAVLTDAGPKMEIFKAMSGALAELGEIRSGALVSRTITG